MLATRRVVLRTYVLSGSHVKSEIATLLRNGVVEDVWAAKGRLVKLGSRPRVDTFYDYGPVYEFIGWRAYEIAI